MTRFRIPTSWRWCCRARDAHEERSRQVLHTMAGLPLLGHVLGCLDALAWAAWWS